MKMDVRLISELSTSGIYTLLLFVSKPVTVDIGKLGKKTFSEGYYTYTRSALGKGATSLKHRISRHLRKQKQKFWHIDYLLADENVSVEAVIATETNKKMECNINSCIKSIKGAKGPVRGFGASDCRKGCLSYLVYFSEVKTADCLVQKLVGHLQSSVGILSVNVLQ